MDKRNIADTIRLDRTIYDGIIADATKKIDHHKQIWLAFFQLFAGNTISYDVFSPSIDSVKEINSILASISKWHAEVYQSRNWREKSSPRLAHVMKLLTDYMSHRRHKKSNMNYKHYSFPNKKNHHHLLFVNLLDL